MMTDRSEDDSDRLAETISKFQDQIEDTKFAIATMRIQLAFRIIMKISEQKKIKASVILFQRLKDITTKKIAHFIERPINIIFNNFEKISERTMIKAFLRVKVYSEAIQKQCPSTKRISMMQSYTDSRKKLTTSSSGYQMTNQEMQEECVFLKDQIKKIERSFQDFSNNLQKH